MRFAAVYKAGRAFESEFEKRKCGTFKGFTEGSGRCTGRKTKSGTQKRRRGRNEAVDAHDDDAWHCYGADYDTGIFIFLHVEKERKVLNMKNLKGFREFLKEEDGMGTVEIILIIVVLIGLVIIFKTQITSIVTKLFGKITNEIDKF